MVIFGKKNTRTSKAGVFGKPAHPSGNLSPEERAFLEAERSMRQEKADTSVGQTNFARRILALIFGKHSVSG